jgi:hypothetical protein
MKKLFHAIFALALLPASLYAVDGQVLINTASVTAAGGFPYVITQPGSYKLSGNLFPPANVNAININSNNVTLDLNGFTIGSAACVPDTCGTTSAYGVFTSTSHPYYNITVRNGTVSGMGVGIYLNGDSFTLEDLHIRNIQSQGIFVLWSGGNNPGSVIVRRNTFDGARVGLLVAGSALVTDNTFSFDNIGASIGNEFSSSVASSMVIGNTFYSNTLGLVLYSGGYLNNNFSGGGVVYGKNLGGNVCNNAVCP